MTARFRISLAILSVLPAWSTPGLTQAVVTQVVQTGEGTWQILRDGEPYYIRGAGTSNTDLIPELALRGGNSIRTWGINTYTLTLLNEARDHGISVLLCLWMNREQDGFDYNDSVKVAAQLEKFRGYVKQFRKHPALLAWSIGNEVDMNYSNLRVWNAVNDISLMIREEDGNHPTLTITADISRDKANAIAERAPDLDMLGINSYGGIGGIRSKLSSSNWAKPYLITEWGVNGPWETSKTSWGAPVEATSSEKAQIFLDRYRQYIEPYGSENLPGSYAFYWNSKFEATETWFGLWVGNETTPMIDALQFDWTSEWPENRAPVLASVLINGKGPKSSLVIKDLTGNHIAVDATDPEGDSLEYEYLVLPEKDNYPVEQVPGATFKCIPGIIANADQDSAEMQFTPEINKQALRLYVLVRDGMGHVATATFPFRTDFQPTGIHDQWVPSDPASQIRLFPNPARERIHVAYEPSDRILGARIYSLQGQLLKELRIPGESATFDIEVSMLADGFYLIELIRESGSPAVHRFVKQ